ncbi:MULTISPECIES: alpha/beta fold hydrolase [unclassified Microbacterium]|uniref:alpha/beta fold hydrolase n=1 Tax=unclassified Microbacterium TaxID=2609290 RepID=UPI0004935601|nr:MULTISPECIES: alpha/beta hydrolase [unclassified Microbacterium]
MTSPLFVERHPGAGRPVVFLHGLASQGAQDWPEAEWGGSFGDRPRVVVDLPAHGASPTLGTAPTSAVLDALADAVGADEIDLVGYSLGARLAWDLVRHPAVAVRRAVLGGLSAGEPFTLVDLPAARAAVSGGAAPADPLTGMIVHMASLPGNRPGDVIDLIEGLAAEPFAPRSDGLTLPVLLIGGTDDAMAAGIDELAQLLPAARAHRVPGDHLSALHTAEFRTAVQDFLAD